MDWPMAPGHTGQCFLLYACAWKALFSLFCTKGQDQAHGGEHHGMDRVVHRAAQAHSSVPTGSPQLRPTACRPLVVRKPDQDRTRL